MGKPVLHWEFWSKDPSLVSAFYAKVFDWSLHEMPELNYTMVNTGGEGGINGGIMRPQDGPVPGSMTLYIDVEDLGNYRRKVVEAGGTIIVEEQEVPGMGMLSLFADPEGRVLGMWQRAR